MKFARTCGVCAAVCSVGWALCLIADRLASLLDAGFASVI